MDINDLILSDSALDVIDNGTWIGDLEGAPGVELLVTGMKSKPARDAMNKAMEVARLKKRNRPLTEKDLEPITKEILYEIILKDWRGLKANGQELKYSKEQAKKWITSRNGEKFTALVLEAAQRVDSEANDLIEEVKKN